MDDLYIPQQKVRTLEWRDQDDPDGRPFRAVVRANLTFGERNTLTFDPETKMTEVHEKLAPFVMSWNAGRLDAKGNPEPVPAPAKGGGESFESVPNAFFWFLWTEVRDHAVQRLDPTPPSDAANTDEPSDDTAPDAT